jgi:hypothetical protein
MQYLLGFLHESIFLNLLSLTYTDTILMTLNRCLRELKTILALLYIPMVNLSLVLDNRDKY